MKSSLREISIGSVWIGAISIGAGLDKIDPRRRLPAVKPWTVCDSFNPYRIESMEIWNLMKHFPLKGMGQH